MENKRARRAFFFMKLIYAGDPYINHFAQADTVIPGAGSSQAWDRYAYAMNNPLRYIDPSGHEACDYYEDEENGDLTQVCNPTVEELTYSLENNYHVEIGEGWDYAELLNLLLALNKFAATVGGVDSLNQTFENVSTDPISFEQSASCGKTMCTHITPGNWLYDPEVTVDMPDYTFTKEYNTAFSDAMRPQSLGLSDPNASIQTTMAHEIGHIFIAAHPSALYEYINNVGPEPDFGSSVPDETLPTAMAIYAIGGGVYPAYQDQIDAASYLLGKY